MANKRLNATITIGGAITGSLRGAFASAGKGLTQLGAEVRKLSNEQRMLGSSIQTFGSMGKNVDGLRAKYVQVTAQLDKMRAATERLARVERAREANMAKRAQIRGQMADAVAIGMTAGAPIVAAVKFENSMLGVAKQLDGARDDSGKLTKEYYDMAQAIQELGRELPVPTNAIAEMVAAGLRMGVAKNEVLDFARRSAEMSTAFDLPEGQLAEDMGKIAGLYKIPIPAIGALADSINYLDDNAISKGGDIISYLTRVGGVASAVKVTGIEMAAMGSTLLTLGERTETASTATNAMFQKFAAADKGTKKFKEAMKEIGLSTKEVQKGMQTDAMGTMLKVLDAISKLDAEKQLGVMVELVGLEHSDTMAKLANNTDEFRKQLKLANSEAAKGSMSREFQARMQTTSAQWEISKNRITELAVTIGSVMLPALNSMMKTIGPMVTSFAEWAKEHPKLTKGIVAVSMGLVGLRVASLAFGYGLTFVKGAVLAVGRAMLMNPIGAAVAAIAGAAYLIYKNWDPIVSWFTKIWGKVKEAASAAWDWFKTNMSWHPVAIIANNWGAITDFFGNLWTSVTNITSMAWDWVKESLGFDPLAPVQRAWEPINGYFQGLWNDITQTFATALNWITGKIDYVGEKWRATKEFFGMGDETPATVVGGNNPPPNLVPPPLPATASSTKSTTYQDNSQNTIQVVQRPGESQEQLTKRILAELEKQKQVRQRAGLSDGAYAQ